MCIRVYPKLSNKLVGTSVTYYNDGNEMVIDIIKRQLIRNSQTFSTSNKKQKQAKLKPK